jgi:hypothetical protein
MNKKDIEKLILISNGSKKSGFDFVNTWLKVGASKTEGENIYQAFIECDRDLISLYLKLNDKHKDLFFTFVDQYPI